MKAITNAADYFWKQYGFELIDTGGGCTAYTKTDEDGNTYAITDGDVSAPEETDQPHTVTITDEHENEISYHIYKNAEEAKAAVPALCAEEEEVTLIASGYDWQCPNGCAPMNHETEAADFVTCSQCRETYKTDGQPVHPEG